MGVPTMGEKNKNRFLLVFLTQNPSIRKKKIFFFGVGPDFAGGPFWTLLPKFGAKGIFDEKSFFTKKFLPLIRFVLAPFQPKVMKQSLKIIF